MSSTATYQTSSTRASGGLLLAGIVGADQVNAPGKARTLAIAATSPAKDTADNTVCPTLDRRGVTPLADDPL